jgi:hypothetical protein
MAWPLPEEVPGPSVSIEARIARAAPRFDLCALIDLLHKLDYKEGDIEYRSHQTTVHQSAVIAAVQFHQVPRRYVVILVNQSLLSPQTALPTYFWKVLEQQQDESLTEFLNFFCHHLIKERGAGTFPERNKVLFKQWQRSRNQLRSLLGPRSMSTIHWVFGLVFPEMEVAVKRTVLQRSLRTRGMVLGSWVIGDGTACGGIAQVPVGGVSISLLCDEPVSGTGRPWADAAMQRLHDEAFPPLAAHGLFLQVILVLRDQRSFMMLQPNQYLGYEPMAHGSPSTPAGLKVARTIILWSGEVPHGHADT